MMPSQPLEFPAIDPVAFSLFGLDIHWYGLAYVAAFFSALYYLNWQTTRYPGKPDKAMVDNLFVWGVLGVILGGRLGYTLFYNPGYYLSHPVEIFHIWEGGMSYHGGLIGVVLAILLFARREHISPYAIADKLAPGVCIGLLFGRLANFINGELYGRVTDVPWGMVFPGGGPLPRHPSQLYEALLEGVVLFVVLHFILRKRWRKGEVSGLFLFGYGVSRFGVEFVRQPDPLAHLQEGIFTVVSMGQLLSLPMIVIGAAMWWWSRRQEVVKTARAS